MIRTVLAVTLAFALLALSLPAIDHGGTEATKSGLEADVATLDAAATALLENEELSPPGQPGPQRVVTVTVPSSSLTTADVEYVVVGEPLETPSGTNENSSDTGPQTDRRCLEWNHWSWCLPAPEESSEGSQPTTPPASTAGDGPTAVTYRLEGGPERTVPIDVPIVPAGGEPVELRGPGDHDLLLTLGRDGDGERVVFVQKR